MWATKANTWSVKEYAVGSMKWHLVDETSLEKRIIKVGWGKYRKEVERTYGWLDCGRKGIKEHSAYDYKLPLIFKESLNLTQANICAYCKKARMKELAIETIQI